MVSALIQFFGMALIVVGLSLWSIPLALVVGGLLVTGIGVTIERENRNAR